MPANGTVSINKQEPQELILLRAAAARSKGTVVRISTGHADGVNADVALADDTNVYRVAVANRDAASGEIYDAVFRGTTQITVPSATYTAGHGVKVFDGALASTGAAAAARDGLAANTTIGVINVGGTSVTSITVTLYGDAFTGTT